VVTVVAALTVAALVVWGVTAWWTRPAPPVEQPVTETPPPATPAIVAAVPKIPRADFEPLYQPKPTEPVLLDLPTAK
jgi:hypothetical protein